LITIEEIVRNAIATITSAEAGSADLEDKERRSGKRFPAEHFFTEWFRRQGTICSFLFKKNHRVTNIQVAELVALLRSYRSDSTRELSFVGVEDYKRTLRHVADSLTATTAEPNYSALAERYSSILANLAAIDIMYGSCVVFLPPGVAVDLQAVCSHSGYIHSCGRNIYIRNIYKATKDGLYRNIKSFIANGRTKHKILFRPYSHEDFTDYDRERADELRFGLDDVKTVVQKAFLGNDRLADVIEDMRDEFSSALIIPYPGDYHLDKDRIEEAADEGDFDPSHALFLITDHSVDHATHARGNRHFIICYDQEWINENPFHLFDENKPAWFDHTTLPHTLAGAMISITRPGWPKQDGPINMCDCFVGSGTTILEAIKFENIRCHGSDYEPICNTLLEDNSLFFSASSDELQKLVNSVSKVATHLDNRDPSPAAWLNSDEGAAWEAAKRIFEPWRETVFVGPESSQGMVSALKDAGLLARLLFYTRLKVARRYEAAIESGSVNESNMLVDELVDLQTSFNQLIRLRERTEVGAVVGHFREYQGGYSQGVSLDSSLLRKLINGESRMQICDCRLWKPNTLLDLIVTDPPYGFNTTEDPKLLADVYASFLSTAIDNLAENGQLVLALPDWSHTGRQLPAFILKDFVTHQVLTIAESKGREVVHSVLQGPRAWGGAPYYWESEKALKRAILHFRFRKRSNYRRNTGRAVALDRPRDKATIKPVGGDE
jgi:hypothetical protein